MSYDSPAADDHTNSRQSTFDDQTARFSSIPIDGYEQPAEDARPLRPLAPAAGADRDDFTHVVIDEKVHCVLREYAKKRAPNRRSIDQHLVGIVGEYAVATWQDVPFNTRITGDYEGDCGYDLELPRQNRRDVRVEVKTTRRQEPRATVKHARIDDADCFVLCRTNRGTDQVDIIGYASRAAVKVFGEQYGIGGYQLTPEYLHVTEGTCIEADEARNTRHRY